MPLLTAGRALWNQRHRLAARAERLRTLSAAVGRPGDLSLVQWTQLLAFALDFRPDLIVDLGRGVGNATCCFLEAADILPGPRPCRVVSLCTSDYWAREARPRLERHCPPDWFARGEVLTRDLTRHDLGPAVRESRRCLVFWTEHGFDVAGYVLGRVLPLLADRRAAVLMHGMSDLRHDGAPPADYGPRGLWTGGPGGPLWLGHVCADVARAVSVVDFTSRNSIPLHSAGEELHAEFAADPDRADEVRRLIGDDLFIGAAHWMWFSPEEGDYPLFYPDGKTTAPVKPGLLRRVLRRCRRLAGKVKRGVFALGRAASGR